MFNSKRILNSVRLFRYGLRAGLAAGLLWMAEGPVVASPAEEPMLVEGRFSCSVLRIVRFPYGGVIDEVACRIGQAVTNGQSLVKYLLYPEAAQDLCRRLNPPQVEDLSLEETRARSHLERLRRQLEEARRLEAQELSSSAEVERLMQEVAEQERQADLLRSRKDTEARLAREDADMLTRLLGVALPPDQTPAFVWLTAPIDGRLISIDPQVVPGAEVGQYYPAVQIGVMDPMILRARVHEREAVRLKPGDPARITATSLPGREFSGTLSRISWAPAVRGLEEPAYFEIEVTVANPDLSIKDGFQGRLEFAPVSSAAAE